MRRSDMKRKGDQYPATRSLLNWLRLQWHGEGWWRLKAACATAFLFLAALATAHLAIVRWEL